jgi:hypothetical protein
MDSTVLIYETFVLNQVTVLFMPRKCLLNFLLLIGMFAIREERDYCVQEDFMKAVRKVQDMKKLETKMDYDKV